MQRCGQVNRQFTVLAVCNASDGEYPVSGGPLTWSTTTPLPPCSGQTTGLSKGTSVKYTSASGDDYILAGTNVNGTPKFHCYNSAKGGSVAEVAAASLDATTC